MKIGVTGDTHGSEQAVRKVLQNTWPVEQWFHTGDYAHDANIIETTTGLPVAKVCGNCDSWENKAKVDEYLEIEGCKICLYKVREMYYLQQQHLKWGLILVD